METINAVIKWPKPKTKTVYAGLYGGHYDVIVFFRTKPLKNTNIDEPGVYDLIDNKDKIAGAMWLSDFVELTGVEMKPESIDVIKIHRMKLTAVWEDDNTLKNFHFHADGW
jgi:hypothetical protein